MLYFFLSYAREDDPVFIRRFFEDLSRDVRDLSGADRMVQVGFLDEQSIQPGQRWVTEVNEALSTCSCFVALTSPRYFRRDYCGREWSAFSERLQIYQQQWSRPAPALLPINWIPAVPMHQVAAEIQRPNLEVEGRPYSEYGLRQMLDLKRFRHDYRTFVFDLARKIIAIAREHSIPRSRYSLPLRHASNAFAAPDTPPAPATGVTGPAGDPPRGGRRPGTHRRYVHFVVVAGTRDEMATTRRKLDYYGDNRIDWSPYWPVADGPLGALATRVANERRFEYEIGEITNLRQRIERARRRNQVVVLLVDTWALELTEHRLALAEYDRQGLETTAVVIPFSVTDAQTLADTTLLQSRLAAALPKSLRRRDSVMLRQNVPTHDHFSASLEEILEAAHNRILRQGTVGARVPGTPPRARPILEGPASTTDGPDR